MAYLGPTGSRLGTGTTRNEQLHREIKSWIRNIYTSHEGRLQNGFRIFEFAKLLTHSSAAYPPTTTKTSQSGLLAIKAGQMRQTGSFPVVPTGLTSPGVRWSQTRTDLHTPALFVNNVSSDKRLKKRKILETMWKKHVVKKPTRATIRTDIFRRPRPPIRYAVLQYKAHEETETKIDVS